MSGTIVTMAGKDRKRKRSCIEHTPVSKLPKKYWKWSEESMSGAITAAALWEVDACQLPQMACYLFAMYVRTHLARICTLVIVPSSYMA